MPADEKPSEAVGQQIARGALWSLLIRVVNRSLGVISTLILARLLTPQDFGVYALAMMIYSFVELLRAFGFGAVLITKQQPSPDHYHTAWTLNLLLSLGTAMLLVGLSSFAAVFFEEPRLELATRFLALLFLIDGFRNIGIIDFQKKMRFDREFRLSVSAKIAGFLTTIPLAYLLNSYWAMLFGLFASSLITLLLSYTMHPFRPRFRLTHWKELFSFGAWLQLNNVIRFLNNHVEKILVSRSLGVASVGSLMVAREVGSLVAEVTQPIHRAAFPGIASVNNDRAHASELFLGVLSMLMLLGTPVAAGIYATAPLLVPLVLGEKWQHISTLVGLLALASVLRVVMASANNLVVAMGKPGLATVVISVRLLIFCVLLALLLPQYGLIAVGYAAGASMAAILVLSFFALRTVLGLTLGQMILAMYRPVTASILMAFFVTTLLPEYAPSGVFFASNLAKLLLIAALGAALYFSVLALLWTASGRPHGSAESQLWREAKKRVFQRFA